MERAIRLTPRTVLTGFLDSGRTTLPSSILQEQRGFHDAVMEVDFVQPQSHP